MKLTRKPWSTTPNKPKPAFVEPTHPGPDATVGEHLAYSHAMMEVQHLRPGYLPQGTRVVLEDGRRATVTNFVPYDGYQIGLRLDKDPSSGLIALRKAIRASSPPTL